MTLIEAARAIMDESPFGGIDVADHGSGGWGDLRSAIIHEEDERRDFERILVLLNKHQWFTADGDHEDELAGAIEQILWRRRARTEQQETIDRRNEKAE